MGQVGAIETKEKGTQCRITIKLVVRSLEGPNTTYFPINSLSFPKNLDANAASCVSDQFPHVGTIANALEVVQRHAEGRIMSSKHPSSMPGAIEHYFKHLDCDELVQYGVDPDIPTGIFFDPAVPLSVCREHPELHVFSKIGQRRFNRYIPGSECYGLSKDDPNPLHEFDVPPLTPQLVQEMADDLRGDGSDPESVIYADALLGIFGNIFEGRPAMEGVGERPKKKRG